jgi:hypothetical protein
LNLELLVVPVASALESPADSVGDSIELSLEVSSFEAPSGDKTLKLLLDVPKVLVPTEGTSEFMKDLAVSSQLLLSRPQAPE